MTTIRATGVEVPLPPRRLRHHRDTDERFTDQAVQLAQLCYRLGLRDHDDVLDVGCSVGRLAIGLLAGTDFQGRYLGFDVMLSHVRWARRHITPLAPDYRFRHADVVNDRYNPDGAVDPGDFTFPAQSDSFDLAVLFSIFTHFYADDIQLYLRELWRVLRPGGSVLTTWLLYDDETYEAAATKSSYPMRHRLDEHTIYHDPDDPLRAIAYHEREVRAWLTEVGFEIVTVEHGQWNGGPDPEFQDFVHLRKPMSAATPDASGSARAAAQSVRRAVGRARRALPGRRTPS